MGSECAQQRAQCEVTAATESTGSFGQAV